MDFQHIIQSLLITMPIFWLSLSVHEAAHAAAAYYLGDPTARNLGRVTLNPLPHIDMLGTVILPILSTITGGVVFIGWAKPVPVDWRNLRNIRRDDSLIAVAGPASNILLSIICVLGIVIYTQVVGNNPVSGSAAEIIGKFLQYGMIINVALAVFNMMPVPPLDGSHVVANILPDDLADRYRSMGMYGILLLLLLLNFTPLRSVLHGIINGIINLYLSFV